MKILRGGQKFVYATAEEAAKVIETAIKTLSGGRRIPGLDMFPQIFARTLASLRCIRDFDDVNKAWLGFFKKKESDFTIKDDDDLEKKQTTETKTPLAGNSDINISTQEGTLNAIQITAVHNAKSNEDKEIIKQSKDVKYTLLKLLLNPFNSTYDDQYNKFKRIFERYFCFGDKEIVLLETAMETLYAVITIVRRDQTCNWPFEPICEAKNVDEQTMKAISVIDAKLKGSKSSLRILLDVAQLSLPLPDRIYRSIKLMKDCLHVDTQSVEKFNVLASAAAYDSWYALQCIRKFSWYLKVHL